MLPHYKGPIITLNKNNLWISAHLRENVVDVVMKSSVHEGSLAWNDSLCRPLCDLV